MARSAALTMLIATAAAAVLTSCTQDRTGRGAGEPVPPAARRSTPAASTTPVRAVPQSPLTTAPSAAVVAVNHCAGNTNDQLVKVSLRAQHMWLCQAGRAVLDTAITSGASSLQYDSTPTGNFHIQGRDTNTVLTLNTGAQYHVKYWIPFSAPLYGFHDASWQQFPFGSSKYKTQGSHGCVHMPLKAIAFLYHWAHVGTPVQIRA